MAASQVSGMKMRTLLFGLFLGLLAVVHSTPVYILDVTQIPTKAEDEFIREVVTDGFLVENLSLPSAANGSPATELPATELRGSPATKLPATKSPATESPATELPATESPATELRGSPATELPATELRGLPTTGSPATELPATELRGSPTTGSPATELPATELRGSPTTGLPTTGLPTTGLPTTGLPTTGLPTTNSTVQASQRPAADSTEGVAIEGSGGETIDEVMTSVSLQFGTTTASPAPSSASTMLPKETGDSSSVPSATQSPPSGSTPVPNEAQPITTPDRISASQTTDPAVSTVGFLSPRGSDSGSGDGEMIGPYFTATTRSSMTSSSSAETSTASQTSTTSTTSTPRQEVPMFPGSEGSGSGEELEAKRDILPTTTGIRNRQRMMNGPNNRRIYEPVPTASPRAEGTPGWMIIVGFIVGLAALVMLFVAIATRDRWNGPSRASKLTDKTNSSNQQREMEVEMQTFLQKDDPRENGHGAEYTVIPLEELPEKYSSH